MTKNNHATDIIEDQLSISFEAAAVWSDGEYKPEQAVLLLTKCCKINHDHTPLNKEQAMVLAEWLVAFANGEYDESN